MMTSAFRRLNLTAHVTSSVGFFGAVASFLILSIAGLTSRNSETVRGAYIAMNLIGQFIIVPLCLTALVTGVLQSLGTEWGLFRHYWVLTKFVLTVGATMLLLLHQLNAVAGAARSVLGTAAGTLPSAGTLGIQLTVDAALAIVVLFAMIVLSIYKPWGMTSYERIKRARPAPDIETPLGLKIFLIAMAVIAVIGAVVSHLHDHGGVGHSH